MDALAPFRAELAALDAAAGGPPPPCRQVYAAVHVVMREDYRTVPHSPEQPGAPEEIAAYVDWEATLGLRRWIAEQGLGIAEAMDTAQRFETGWPVAERLIRETAALAPPAGFVAGAAADHEAEAPDRDALVEAWAWQARFILEQGGTPVLLPQPALCAWGLDADAFVEVHAALLERIPGPVWLHWLGEAFHPGLQGYFPGDSLRRILALDREQVRGVKVSLLEPARERALRRELMPYGQVVLTGDDHHFATLISGDAPGDFSHALLGILDAVAEPAGLALRFLAHGRRDRYAELMVPCERLGRHLFAPPVPAYKAGLAWLAWRAGRQPNPMLPNHAERLRDERHLQVAERLATAARCLGTA